MKTVEGRVAVVTGAASGIGRAMVQTFVDAGMKVVLADIDEARLLDTTRKIRPPGEHPGITRSLGVLGR